jgi:hypothetical protein
LQRLRPPTKQTILLQRLRPPTKPNNTVAEALFILFMEVAVTSGSILI